MEGKRRGQRRSAAAPLHAEVKADFVVMYNEPSRIERDGGPCADELEVAFLAEGKEKLLLVVIKSLEPDNRRMGGLKLSQATVDSARPDPETRLWADV